VVKTYFPCVCVCVNVTDPDSSFSITRALRARYISFVLLYRVVYTSSSFVFLVLVGRDEEKKPGRPPGPALMDDVIEFDNNKYSLAGGGGTYRRARQQQHVIHRILFIRPTLPRLTPKKKKKKKKKKMNPTH